jgi:hypothetical protein
VRAKLHPDIESFAPADAWDAFGARSRGIFLSSGHYASLATVAARVVCCLIESATAVWFVQALPGSGRNVADGINDGIPAEVVCGCPMFAMFERKRTLNFPMQSVQSRQLPTGFFGILGGIVAT